MVTRHTIGTEQAGMEGGGGGDIIVGASSRRIIDTSEKALLARLKKQGHLGLRITLQVRIPEANGYSPVEGFTMPIQVTGTEGLKRVEGALKEVIQKLRGEGR
ncbi:MAG: hypothetical protein KGL39_16015 [Patescibacteria group bacterium]|nr:hypothetical protein [Patescibacteria group bacterium]